MSEARRILEAEAAEHDAALEARANDVLSQTGFGGIDVKDGELSVTLAPPHDLVAAMARALADNLGTAENYTETPFAVEAPDGGPPENAQTASMDVHAAGDMEWYVLTVQRKYRKTPHQLRREAEAETERVKALLVEALGTLETWRGDGWYDVFSQVDRIRREAGLS